ncbi:hypothetical protein [Mycolicibacterium iranicum]|uniref:Uncharacterized protein n=1 Tax=Mycolicibacterium iranicum TaxID=912594 RepID=A0ABT4HK87_MYCIR|nr:hypothetical protein [Mycolicibacterium iranicum]MCZ0730627.1 hypothetical protein [Mycolicibacterium iranicum]
MTSVVSVSSHEVVEVETPQERAQRRLGELGRAASGVLEVLAAIYRDQDWRFLLDRDGQSYNDFGHFIRDQLGGSASNARRYRQGVETLVAPLQEIVGPGTQVPVTPNDVALLGVEGARQVVSAAASRLGELNAGEQTQALRALIEESIAARPRRSSPVVVVDGDLDELPPAPSAIVPPSEAEAIDEAGGPMPAGESATADGSRAVVMGDCSEVDAGALCRALALFRDMDPAVAATVLSAGHGPVAAGECVEAARRLARLGQILDATR